MLGPCSAAFRGFVRGSLRLAVRLLNGVACLRTDFHHKTCTMAEKRVDHPWRKGGGARGHSLVGDLEFLDFAWQNELLSAEQLMKLKER